MMRNELDTAARAAGRARRGVLAGVLALAGLSGCDPERIAKLEEGVATEADVRQQFGAPEIEYLEADGSRTLAYPRQPEGRTNYMITIGPDGRMSALRQVLKPTDFARIAPGMDKAAVRRLLGKPAAETFFALKQQEDWDWYWMDQQARKLHTVTFDAQGKVVASVSSDDMREVSAGGR
jgi:hypothetical protein